MKTVKLGDAISLMEPYHGKGEKHELALGGKPPSLNSDTDRFAE